MTEGRLEQVPLHGFSVEHAADGSEDDTQPFYEKGMSHKEEAEILESLGEELRLL